MEDTKMTKYSATATGGASINLKSTTLSTAKVEAASWASFGNSITLWANGVPVADFPFVLGGFLGDGQGSRHYSHGPWENC